MALLGATHCCTAQLTPVYFQVVSPEKHGCTSANAVRVPVLRVPAISAPTCPWDWRDSEFQPLGALGIGGTYSQFSPKVPVGLAGLRISAPRTLGAGEIQRNQPPSTLGTGGGTQSLQSAGTLGTGETQSISVPRYPWGWRDSFISVPRYPWDRRDSIHFIAKRCLGLAGLSHFSPKVPLGVAGLSDFSPNVPLGLAGLISVLGSRGDWALHIHWHCRVINRVPRTGTLTSVAVLKMALHTPYLGDGVSQDQDPGVFALFFRFDLYFSTAAQVARTHY